MARRSAIGVALLALACAPDRNDDLFPNTGGGAGIGAGGSAGSGSAGGAGGSESGGSGGVGGGESGGSGGVGGSESGGSAGVGGSDTGGSAGVGGSESGGSAGVGGGDTGGSAGVGGSDTGGSAGAGGSDTGGTAGVGGETGGAAGVGGSGGGGSGGDSGGKACVAAREEYQSALAQAKQCTPLLPQLQCEFTARGPCCPTTVNDGDSVEKLGALVDAMLEACGPSACPAIECRPTPSRDCMLIAPSRPGLCQ